MENTNNHNPEDFKSNTSSEQIIQLSQDLESKIEKNEIGVQHDEDGNIIKIAENAVPPKAWENQKKAYSDAFENNKNLQLEEDFE